MADQLTNLDTEPLTKDAKMLEDWSKQSEECIKRANDLSAAGRVEEAVEEVYAVEKKARQACDAISCSKLTRCVLQLYKEKGDWKSVNEQIQILTRKRGQLKRAVIDMVQLAMSWLEKDMPSIEEKVTLINTLLSVTEGKIFVEVERARVTRTLAHMRESEGKVEEAASLMQEVQVETFGAMDRTEKAEYILDQMRLVLAKKDYVRCQIISKKINPKLLETDDFQDIKLQYFGYMVRYFLHEEQIMDVCKSLWSSFNTKKVKESSDKWQNTLESYLLYLLLAPSDNEQKDMLHKCKEFERKKLEQIPVFKRLLTDFLTVELMPWPLPYEAELKKHAVFQETPHEGGAKRWELFHKRITQHNIMVAAQYYKRSNMDRLAQMLGLTIDQLESEISELVSSKFLSAKIDRPAKQVTFGAVETSADVLNAWNMDIAKALDLVEESCHLIQKERMVHAARGIKA
eukprot:GDKI01021764.1.p1 GENE.GDKI01021764.1~~GDKI01021764.1.p1  ORF type:complete len:493 (+),score=186.36 GDKI01021764.1:105-1481(+)